MVRQQLASAFPEDRVLGEEQGGDASGAGRVWIVDPIDATANFARGIPIWATLIALQVDGEQVLGVVNAPALGERYQAVRGEGARCNDVPIGVSDIGDAGVAQLSFAGAGPWIRTLASENGCSRHWRRRSAPAGFGDFWGHMLVARGSAEAMLEPELALWDYAALVPIVEEAGGRMTTLEASTASARRQRPHHERRHARRARAPAAPAGRGLSPDVVGRRRQISIVSPAGGRLAPSRRSRRPRPATPEAGEVAHRELVGDPCGRTPSRRRPAPARRRGRLSGACCSSPRRAH